MYFLGSNGFETVKRSKHHIQIFGRDFPMHKTPLCKQLPNMNIANMVHMFTLPPPPPPRNQEIFKDSPNDLLALVNSIPARQKKMLERQSDFLIPPSFNFLGQPLDPLFDLHVVRRLNGPELGLPSLLPRQRRKALRVFKRTCMSPYRLRTCKIRAKLSD
jgi:hypothetical protein